MESSISESKPRPTRPTGIYGQSIPVIEDYFVNPTGFSARESGLIVPDRMKNDSFSLLISGEVDGAMFILVSQYLTFCLGIKRRKRYLLI